LTGAADRIFTRRCTCRCPDCGSHQSYMKSEAHRISHGRINPELDAEIKLQALEHMHTFNVVAE
jgi:hypothetical protein